MINKTKKSANAEFIKWFGPLINGLKELGGSGKPKEVAAQIAKDLNIPDKQLEETMKSGILRFQNQVAWARQYLVWEGLVDDSKHGIWTLTPKGQNSTLSLEQSREVFLKWGSFHKKTKKTLPKTKVDIIQLEEEPEHLESEITPTLLEVLQTLSPIGFEQISKRLLREHGFENVVVTQATRDGGIDGYGILELNPFVSIKVLFQCKRYKGKVSRAEVGDFRNAMLGRAEKGIIITTGTFSEDAKREASRDGAPPIELIDGNKLVELFEAVHLGVRPKTVFEVEYSFFDQYIKK
ncbi:MAG: restriction endonuclease [Bacteroidia bacterium]|nr:restriction endonuclease [Bacteroidia bacterium]